MEVLKDDERSIVHVMDDGNVHKQFKHIDEEDTLKRFNNEVNVLRFLEEKGCDFVPRLIDVNEDELSIVMTHCGGGVNRLSNKRFQEIFKKLETYGIRHHDMRFPNITYKNRKFFVIDFEKSSFIT